MSIHKEEILLDQYRLLEREYNRYSRGEINQEEYLHRAKSIDESIDRLEMTALMESSVLKKKSPLDALKSEK